MRKLQSRNANIASPVLIAACVLMASSCYWGTKNGNAPDAVQPGSGGQPALLPPPATAPDAGRAAQVVVTCPDPATSTTAPLDVFCIGLYENHDATKLAASALPYTPGVLLWSDGAEKKRYLALPAGTKIDTSDMDAWKFPIGTKAFKEFRFNGKLVETRMVWKQAEHNTVYATYIWDETETNAALNQSMKPTILPSGYEIPDLKDCGRCHHGGADKYLGIEAVALALPTAEGVTLTSLVAGGWLTNPPDHTSITLPEDATGKAAAAIGYLHANCGMPCHSSRGLGDDTQLLLRLRADEFWPPADVDAGIDPGTVPTDVTATDAYVHTVNQKPTTASVAQKFPDAVRIQPGAHDKSLLWLLAHRRGEYQMPPLVSHQVDDEGTQKLADWIDALTP